MNDKLKILYVANVRIPTEKAHGIQIMATCEAMAKLGHKVTLVVPSRRNKIKKDPFDFYGVEKLFKIKKLPVIDLVWADFPFSFFLESVTFAVSLFFYLAFRREEIIYVRGETVLFLKRFLGKKLFWETHIKPKEIKLYEKIFRKAKGLIVVNKGYKDEIAGKYGVSADNILWAPDGVDLEKFNINLDKNQARQKISLPPDKKIIMYIGSLTPWKGTDVMLRIAPSLDQDFLIAVIAGGEKDDVEKFKNKLRIDHIENIILFQYQPHNKIPVFMKAADLLVLTGTKKSDTSMYYTSPLKLFEYMASKRPILSADIPSFREIIAQNSAFFYKPDDEKDMAVKVKYIFENYMIAEEKAAKSFEEARKYTWLERAKKISDFMQLKVSVS